jgi:hypothetical protein
MEQTLHCQKVRVFVLVYTIYVCMRKYIHIDGGHLGRDAVWTCRWAPTFRRSILPRSSGNEIYTASQPTLHHRETLKSHTIKPTFYLLLT